MARRRLLPPQDLLAGKDMDPTLLGLLDAAATLATKLRGVAAAAGAWRRHLAWALAERLDATLLTPSAEPSPPTVRLVYVGTLFFWSIAPCWWFRSPVAGWFSLTAGGWTPCSEAPPGCTSLCHCFGGSADSEPAVQPCGCQDDRVSQGGKRSWDSGEPFVRLPRGR